MSLKKYIPSVLYDEKTLNKTYSAQESKLTEIDNNIQDLINNCFAQTATSWGLNILEGEYGLTTIDSDSDEIRRSRVLAQIRSKGIVTKAMIQNLAESFANGSVDVIEDDANYTFTIKFISTIGVPPKIEDLYSAINKIKPAHLLVEYLFTYKLWNDMKNFEWGDLQPYTWQQVLSQDIQSNIKLLYYQQSDGTYTQLKLVEEAVTIDSSDYTLYSQTNAGEYDEMLFQ